MADVRGLSDSTERDLARARAHCALVRERLRRAREEEQHPEWRGAA